MKPRIALSRCPRTAYLISVAVYFLSDLHLSEGQSPAAARFVSFLAEKPRASDELVLGGDIFDLFVGNKAPFRARFTAVLEAIAAAARRGVRVHYLEGNHDFHLDAVFPAGLVRVRGDEFPLEAEGRRIWVSHGDWIDEKDRGYRLLRRVTRHFFFRRLFLPLVPGVLVARIGAASSRTSRRYNTAERLSAERQAYLRGIYRAYAQSKVREGYQHVLVGHSHLRDQVELGEGEYVNLGFSGETLLYGVLEAGATRFRLSSYP